MTSKTLRVGALSLLLLFGAAPALAQPSASPHAMGGSSSGWDFKQRLDWMFQRVDKGRADGSLSRSEADRVRRQLEDIRHDADAYYKRGQGPTWDHDRKMLEARLDKVNDQIHWQRSDGQQRPW